MAGTLAGRARRSGYFFWMAVVMWACVVVGFGSSLALGNYNDVTPLPTYLIVHGVALLAWFSWLVLQTSLVRTNNIALHRKTGLAGIAIALLVIATTPKVFLSAPARLMSRGLTFESDLSQFPPLGIEGTKVGEFVPTVLFASTGNLFLFTLLFGAALWFRANAEVHKRMMLFASIAIFAPALARLARLPGVGGEDSPVLPIVLLAFIVSPLVHDKLARGKVHKASWAGMALILVVQGSLVGFASSEAGRALARSIIG